MSDVGRRDDSASILHVRCAPRLPEDGYRAVLELLREFSPSSRPFRPGRRWWKYEARSGTSERTPNTSRSWCGFAHWLGWVRMYASGLPGRRRWRRWHPAT